MNPGDQLQPLRVVVDPEKMKILAGVLRDPNPIHWDRGELEARGLGDRLINQGPINLGYVANMLAANFGGHDRIARLTARFGDNVREGDEVVARGVVTAVDLDEASIEVWLELPDGARAVDGTALVRIDRE